jgi:hypothetical protein
VRRQIADEHKNPQTRWQCFDRLPDFAAGKKTEQKEKNPGASAVMQKRLKHRPLPILPRFARLRWGIHKKWSAHYAAQKSMRQALQMGLQSRG